MELTEKQLETIEYYCGNNMAKLRQLSYPLFIKFGGITPKDYDEFYSEANNTIIGVIKMYDNSKGGNFEGFLISCLSRKFKTLMTRRNRNKRFADRICSSLDAPIGDENGTTLAEVIPAPFYLENELNEEIGISSGGKMEKYLDQLSKKQKDIAIHLSEGYKPPEIRDLLHITEKEYSDCMMAIKSYKNIKILL